MKAWVPSLLLAIAPLALAQQAGSQQPGFQGPAQMVAIDLNAACTRLLQLMEAGGGAGPALRRAAAPRAAGGCWNWGGGGGGAARPRRGPAAPRVESAGQACSALQALPGGGPTTYA